MSVTVGEYVPDFTAPANSNKKVQLSACKGFNVILYFYPKDSTPCCTNESIDFRDHYQAFKDLKTVIFGISRDSLKSHENFKAKHDFPFELISDPDEEVCQLFNVMQLKNMYGKKIMGVERSTFLIDKEGILRKEWRKVKVKEHIVEVLEETKKLP